MSIPYTRETAELVALFSPSAAQADSIRVSLSKNEASVFILFFTHTMSAKMRDGRYSYYIAADSQDDAGYITFPTFPEMKEAIRAEAEAIIEKEGAEK